jgi:hypothetical protein
MAFCGRAWQIARNPSAVYAPFRRQLRPQARHFSSSIIAKAASAAASVSLSPFFVQ